ncbi:response regulator transcription factor, partial [Nodosilinea sp. LEGE 07298]|uniref:response regulator transcription factor n=1 Tax=Nodosilinea sp. LEGE 07298 TaxID=2777970 RepID=UPI00187DF631
MRILLVDDDELLTQQLADFLVSQHYAVDVVLDGEAGWDYAQAADYDLIVLDINLPKLDGIRLCQKLRQARYGNPILLLTAQGDSSDKVVGLDAGADDYLVKPCTLNELSARIRALLRRPSTLKNPVLRSGDLCIDPSTCEVTYQGKLLSLSPKEYSLLELFLRRPQQVFSSTSILEHLWSFDDTPAEETVRTHIKRLRHKLKAVGAGTVIDTVYGMGYRLQPPLATP